MVKNSWWWMGFCGLLFFSPLIINLAFFPKSFGERGNHWNLTSHEFLQELNTARGELDVRIYTNKFFWAGWEMLGVGITGLDSHFLFFEGDINPYRSNKMAGVAVPAAIGFFIFGWYGMRNKKRLIVLGLLLASAGLSAVYKDAFYITPRIPLILIVYGVCARGFAVLVEKYPKVAGILVLIWMWQEIEFYHFANNHYLKILGIMP
jgi:hypothetical protein